MLENAQAGMLLVDHSKFGRTMLDLICPLSDLTDVVVDLTPAPPLLGALKTAEVVINTPEEDMEVSVG